MNGLCLCGCGKPAPLAPHTDRKRGWIKGQPTRYRHGHAGYRAQPIPIEDRFWEYVDASSPDGCWPWLGACDPVGGYGRTSINHVNKLAHRVAYELTYGSIPDGQVIRHSCDNPPCVNPAHLSPGAHLDNARDAVERDRIAFGERCPWAVLDEAKVREIRHLRGEGWRISALATHFRVGRGAVRGVVEGKTWRRVSDVA